MSTDITRRTFDPASHFSRVVMQQGRVALDADWNEQSAILLHYMRTLATDIIGRCAGPQDNFGFEIVSAADPGWEARLKVLGAKDARYAQFHDAVGDGNLLICPGRYYVDGILVESDAPVLYNKQLGYPFKPTAILPNNQWTDPVLLFLKVWEREITYVQDDRIREVALGGPDTSGRTQVCWQVQALPKPGPDTQDFGCGFVATMPPFGAGTLRARARQATAATAPCVIAPDAFYRGAQNHLYRVEIHQGGVAANTLTDAGGKPTDGTGEPVYATFKWSRDNAAAVFPIRALNGASVELETLGRDRRFGLASGQWVEFVNDRIEAGGKPGPLFQIDTACNDSLTVTLKRGTDPMPELAGLAKEGADLHPLLRLWNQAGDANFAGAVPVVAADDTNPAVDGWVELEDGIQIRFVRGKTYQAGDYWLIPARVATGNIEWRQETDTLPAALQPHGPHYHYAPLLLIASEEIDGTPAKRVTAKDCRCLITPICPPAHPEFPHG